MRVVGVIPSRWGSTRLPGKSLREICGKPLVQHVWERALECGTLDDVIVATDDQRIHDVVTEFGGHAVMTRADHPSGTDRIAEAVAGLDADLIVNLQGDEPLLDAGLVDSLVEHMLGDHWDMGTAAAPLVCEADLHDPSIVKVVFGAQHQALYFSRSVIPYRRDSGAMVAGAEAAGIYWRHIGLYAYHRPFLMQFVAQPPCLLEQMEKLEQLRALYMGCRMLVLETSKGSIGVDTPEDVERVAQLLRERGGSNG